MQNIKFMYMIDVLKEMSKGKYIPFSKYTGEEDYEENVVYDDIHPNEDGTYRLPLDIIVNELAFVSAIIDGCVSCFWRDFSICFNNKFFWFNCVIGS